MGLESGVLDFLPGDGAISIMCSKWADISTCCQLYYFTQAKDSPLAGSVGKFVGHDSPHSAMPEVLLPHIFLILRVRQTTLDAVPAYDHNLCPNSKH